MQANDTTQPVTAQVAINSQLNTISSPNWHALFETIRGLATLAGEPIRTIGIIIKGH